MFAQSAIAKRAVYRFVKDFFALLWAKFLAYFKPRRAFRKRAPRAVIVPDVNYLNPVFTRAFNKRLYAFYKNLISLKTLVRYQFLCVQNQQYHSITPFSLFYHFYVLFSIDFYAKLCYNDKVY